MADNYLITGYWGEPHVTVENDRGINAGIFGTGRFVLPVGEQFKAEYIGNNTVRMYDGKLMNNGAAAGIPAGEYVDLLIANAGQGMNRNDLIVFQYSQDASTLIETGKFVVIQGAETNGTASDPTLTHGDLLSGKAAFDQMALWRVSVSGTAISAPVQVFDLYDRNQSGHNLLWENPDPTSNYGSSTYVPVALDLSKYSMVMVWYRLHASGTEHMSCLVPVGVGSGLNHDEIANATNCQAGTNNKWARRYCYATETGVVFGQGGHRSSVSDNYTISNAYFIPERIYGIR